MMYDYYPIKEYGKDFEFLDLEYGTKGSRKKVFVRDMNTRNLALFKYADPNYVTSELCSEKMAYEFAKILEFKCARIELARDMDGKDGVLNYLFASPTIDESSSDMHTDIVDYMNKEKWKQREFYTLDNVIETLESLNGHLIDGFVQS